MSPGALDPFNAQAGNPFDWLNSIYSMILGAEFVTAHGYVRGPDSSLVGSPEKFANVPLRRQYLNFPGCVTALLESLPEIFKTLPIYITEACPLWKTSEEFGDWGWVSDARADELLGALYGAAEECGFAGLALYRWAGDEWALENNAVVKNGVLSLL
jgi:hypothetical protein